MKKRFTLVAVCLTVGFGLFLGFNIMDNSPNGSRTGSTETSSTKTNPSPVYDNSVIKYQDDMDGANDTTALKSRGYKIFRANPIGTTAAWFQGNDAVFPAFNGPTTGYTAANYNAVTGANNIDSWLIFPKVNTNAGDTLTFVSRAPAASTFPDSIRVMYSATGDSTTGGSWVELGRFKVNTAGTWESRSFVAPSAGANARFAIRYSVVNGGPSGSNSDFIGIDAVTIHGPAAPVLGDFTAYAVDVRNGNVVRLNNCNRTIKMPAPGRSIFAGDFNSADVWYGMQADSLVTIDTATGAITFLGLVTGATTGNNLGMTWDPSTNTMYFMRSLPAGSTLYTLNLTTRVATSVGLVSPPTNIMIELACSNEGDIYAWSLSDSLYSVNKSTGASTLIGPLGVNINFAQGGDFDPASNTLIMAGYIGTGVNHLYELNLSTGAATLICSPPLGEYDAFSIAGTITGVNPVSGQIPDKYTLSQNYPNPFNPTTKIKFALPKAGLVSLKVYDMLGKEVQTLVNQQLNAGEFTADFDGANLSSGTYFYRLQVGDFVEIKKMVLLK